MRPPGSDHSGRPVVSVAVDSEQPSAGWCQATRKAAINMRSVPLVGRSAYLVTASWMGLRRQPGRSIKSWRSGAGSAARSDPFRHCAAVGKYSRRPAAPGILGAPVSPSVGAMPGQVYLPATAAILSIP
jgi:hypothetical protein